MSIIGDWYDENYVIPMTKQIDEQKKLLKECQNLLLEIKSNPKVPHNVAIEKLVNKIKEKIN